MPPRRDPDAGLQADMARMAQAVTGLTRLMMQQTTTNAAQAEANAQREVAENERQAQRHQRETAENERQAQRHLREEAAAQARGLSD